MDLIRRSPALALLALGALVSCRGPKVPVGIGEGAAGAEGIRATAVLPGDPGLIQKLFKAYPPDSGVVPVYLTVTNGDTAAVVLHSLGNLPLGERFRSITLEAGAGPIDPIHPLEVVMHLEGRADAPDYRQMGAWHVVGGILIPPLGIYYIFKWGDYALDYRPMLRNSFFPAGRGGAFEPVRIGPGESASGFLFFPLAPPASPYYTEYEPGGGRGDEPVPVRRVRGESGLELSLRPAGAPGGAGAIPDEGHRFEAAGMRRIRIEDADPGHARYDLFLLGRGREGDGDLDLLIGSSRVLSDSRDIGVLTPVKRINNKTGDLVDASAGGGFAVCAVNFKQKSRLFSVDLRGAVPSLAAELRLDRSVLRVFALPSGIFAVTEDGFCGVYGYEDLARGWYGRLGTSVSDAASSGGRILAFGGGTIDEFLCEGGRCEGPGRRGPAPARGIRRGVRAGSSSLVVHRGRGALGDTLVLYDLEGLRERARLPLPGRIAATDAWGTLVAVQVEGGVLMLFETGEEREPSMVDAGWLPEEAAGLLIDGAGGIMISREGAIRAFELDSIRPAPPAGGAGGELRVPVGIGAPGGGGG